MQMNNANHRGSQGSRRNHARRARPCRAALAPLELVLNLVFLLVVMALIINAGAMATWHARGSVASRYAAWRMLSPRTGKKNPSPTNWKSPAKMGLAAPMSLSQEPVGRIWRQDDLSQSALRGPTVIDPATSSQIMLSDLKYLEMIDQALIGSAELTKSMPLLPRLRKSQINPRHPVFDDAWRFDDMSQKTGWMALRSNEDWRLRKWYLFETSNLADVNIIDATSRLNAADVWLRRFYYPLTLTVYQNAAIDCVDRDVEFSVWEGRSPDFYPTVSGCEISIENIRIGYIEGPQGLINRIQGPNGGGRGGLPERMAREFIRIKQVYAVPWYSTLQLPDRLASELQDLRDLQKFLEILY